MARRFKGWPPPPRPRDGEGNKIPKRKKEIEYNIKDDALGKVEVLKPGTTFQTPSGSQFRMLESGSLIRADRSKHKMNKKERRINRNIVKARTAEVKAKVEAYENTMCICHHKRISHKEDQGACLGCTCSRFTEEGHPVANIDPTGYYPS